MRVTLYEIAQATGVSVSTVSRVLNNDKSKPASKATTERIIKAAYDLGYYTRTPETETYIPEPAHRNLTCFLASASDTYNDYFFSQLLLGIQEESGRMGYSITHTLSTSTESAESICKRISDTSPDGVILMGRVSKKIMNFLNTLTLNMVYTGLNKLDVSIDQVICDGYGAIVDSVNYLVKCGFTKIGFIGTIPSEKSDILNEHRFRAFSDAVKLNDLKLDMNLCKNIQLGTEQAYNAVIELLRSGEIPEAFCCANDMVAIGVISALTDYQYRVPEDVSVIGLDDIEMAKFMKPRLTTFNMQNRELGKFAVKILDDRINGLHSVPAVIQLPSTLMVRDSCTPNPRKHSASVELPKAEHKG
ncbi:MULTISPECIES: LacI family DNA-binding transcriptional regulator [unclassified Lactonifactor]|uniref:LacI family DNA-binding transcriptional regulator n=1 Tax=Lactonifactor TaxID=420345 RepID=UPI0012B0A22A|nr:MULTISPECIES: LacI family DNA-binding transcriptional regulator [unclassified Lactonifactor]MSA00158.1 LacI family DNA-binding transcriptional regulator [Lactonifactor sp. BIOML-A5]MSA06785.1 LacI family DNA-binding transcriptional regulator [Lactonifactor sp. BIOML-A4]MSA11003.1 LacI family DNA-binding transcriptional regulator [Lactonifactor sp. BIOML-A3]MSA16017.1 LacI family DNA-binding transcriptional regulator [Lactonifactor sp. BIOML-A2]MSA36621.1 LacI family DNA-binding transcriptio